MPPLPPYFLLLLSLPSRNCCRNFSEDLLTSFVVVQSEFTHLAIFAEALKGGKEGEREGREEGRERDAVKCVLGGGKQVLGANTVTEGEREGWREGGQRVYLIDQLFR
jgi:hypothetical protein